MSRRINGRAIKRHRNYTVEEAAHTLNVAKGTVRRWITSGLPVLNDQRPALILGQDLLDYLAKKSPSKQRCLPHQAYCFSCRIPRDPAFGELEYYPITPANGQLRSLCCQCSTVMNKATSSRQLAEISIQYTVRVMQADERLSNGDETPSE